MVLVKDVFVVWVCAGVVCGETGGENADLTIVLEIILSYDS
jgi:hypothetical protein